MKLVFFDKIIFLEHKHSLLIKKKLFYEQNKLHKIAIRA